MGEARGALSESERGEGRKGTSGAGGGGRVAAPLGPVAAPLGRPRSSPVACPAGRVAVPAGSGSAPRLAAPHRRGRGRLWAEAEGRLRRPAAPPPTPPTPGGPPRRSPGPQPPRPGGCRLAESLSRVA